jgi:hypothetical protein
MPISDYQYGLWYVRGSEDSIKGYPPLFVRSGNDYRAGSFAGCSFSSKDEEHQSGFAYMQGYYAEESARKDGLG